MSTLADIGSTLSGIPTLDKSAYGELNLLDYIPQTEWAAIQAYTSSYDCLSSINAAVSALTSSGGKIVMPPGLYHFSGTIELAKFVNLQGAGTGLDGGQPTQLKFPANTRGIHIGGSNSGANAKGTRLAGLCILGSNNSAGTGEGVFVEFRAEIEDCIIGVFGGNGVTIGASTPSANANNWQMRNCYIAFNHADGLQVYGTDANAGTAIGVSALGNAGWGIADQSFLGNTFVGCHTQDNALGAYLTDNANARAVFLGCYSESGQPGSQIVEPSMVVGGLHAAGFTNATSAQVLTSDYNSPFAIRPTAAASPLSFGLGGNNSALYLSADSGNTTWQIARWEPTYNAWVIGYANSTSDILLTTTPGTGFIYDYDNEPNPVPAGATVYNKTRWVFLGGQTAKQVTQTYASAAPGAGGGTWKLGDIIFNISPAPSGYIGWVCTTAGTAGVDAVFKAFGAISA